MKPIEFRGRHGLSRIFVGESLRNLHTYLPAGTTVLVADRKVYELYREDFPQKPLVLIPGGERAKSMKTVNMIIQKFIDHKVDRSCFVVGVGGGVVCDLTGFASSIYMRGLPFGFVATTLLAQVDAAIGGKNGVNVNGRKNMMGTVTQPVFVLCDLSLLGTLTKRDIVHGLAEMVKHGLIGSREHWDDIESHAHALLNLEDRVLKRLVSDSVSVKVSVIQEDETDKGKRRILNFGHTIGHALELHDRIPHGEAVSLGMMADVAFSRQEGYLSATEEKRIRDLYHEIHLPVSQIFNIEQVLRLVMNDKKREGELLPYVLLKGIGNAIIKPYALKEFRLKMEKVLKAVTTR